MIKIVNGKIVREGVVSATGSPVVQRRRGSIADLQIKEYAQETVQPIEEAPAGPLTWTDILSLEINVFGVQLSVKNLAIISLVAFLWTGLMGLLVSLLALYIGTVFSEKAQATQQPATPTTESPKMSPSLNLSSSSGGISNSPQILRSSGGSSTASPSVLRTSGSIVINGVVNGCGSSSPLLRPLGSPSLRPVHPRLVTLKSLELDNPAISASA